MRYIQKEKVENYNAQANRQTHNMANHQKRYREGIMDIESGK